MQNLKYYVIWKKNSPLLKEYLDKYYYKLIKDLEIIKFSHLSTGAHEGRGVKKSIINLLSINNRDFILNPDISSMINYIIINLNNLLENNLVLVNLKREIDIFLLEWIKSNNLTLNKWEKIAWTNIRLSLYDNNPLNMQEAHPDHKSNWGVLWFWDASEKDWLNIYNKTFNLLKILDEWIYDELNQIIKKIVPLGTSKWLHNSASYKECIGHLYMWFTIDSSRPEINNLEAIIHESSHNKLNLIMQFDPVVLNTKEEKYYSAIRPDARHIHWVFLWYHAFAPTMYMLMKAYKQWMLWNDIHWLEKIVLYYIKTKFLQKVIKKYAKLTDLGKEISEEIDYVIFKMDILFKEINPSKELILMAKDRQVEHFKEVNHNYPYLEY